MTTIRLLLRIIAGRFQGRNNQQYLSAVPRTVLRTEIYKSTMHSTAAHNAGRFGDVNVRVVLGLTCRYSRVLRPRLGRVGGLRLSRKILSKSACTHALQAAKGSYLPAFNFIDQPISCSAIIDGGAMFVGMRILDHQQKS